MKDDYELKKIKTLEIIGLHRQRVFQIMSRLSQEMILRGNKHDESKFESEELPYYIDTQMGLKTIFDSEGYYVKIVLPVNYNIIAIIPNILLMGLR